jgi:hypothetical protein
MSDYTIRPRGCTGRAVPEKDKSSMSGAAFARAGHTQRLYTENT